MAKITTPLIKPERRPDKYKRVMGIDSSSLGVAWTCVADGEPVSSGFIKLDKIKTIQDKLKEIIVQLSIVLDEQKPDHIAVEMPIFVKNPATARTLSFVVGTIISQAEFAGYETSLLEIASWKSYIGYFNLSAKFQGRAKEVLGLTEGKKLCVRLRKEQTQRILKLRYPYFDVENDNISDSCAISLYTWNRLASELKFEKNKDMAFDLMELGKWGLDEWI